MSRPHSETFTSTALGIAAATGLGMIPLHRLPRPVRAGYVVLPAALASGLTLLAQQRASPRQDSDEQEGSKTPSAAPLRAPTAFECGMSLAFGGALVGAGASSIAMDRWVEDRLRSWGAPVPRVLMGMGSGALMGVMSVVESRAPAENAQR